MCPWHSEVLRLGVVLVLLPFGFVREGSVFVGEGGGGVGEGREMLEQGTCAKHINTPLW